MVLLFVVELMLLGFISLLLTATSRTISSICIDSKFYNSNFSPCTRSEVDDSVESDSGSPPERKQLMEYLFRHSMKRLLSESTHGTCTEACVYICFYFADHFLVRLLTLVTMIICSNGAGL